MNIPKVTELSLRTIAENAAMIPSKEGFSQGPPPMTLEEKRQLKEMALMFHEYGMAFQTNEKLMDSAKAVGAFMELAERYATERGADVFQENIVKQNFQEARKKVAQLQKMAQETYVRNQQCAALYDDVRHVVERYYMVQNEAAVPSVEPVATPPPSVPMA